MNTFSRRIIERRTAAGMPVRPVVFNDGAELSVQAGKYHYSVPKSDDPGPNGWQRFEVWCWDDLSDEDLEDMGVQRGDEPTSVSLSVLDKIATRHGGIKE